MTAATIGRGMEPNPALVRLVRQSHRDTMASGGTVTYDVYLAGRWIGWVGDERPWLGHRHGGRRWWACWRQDGDIAARWNSTSSGHSLASRRAAVTALVTQVRTHEGSS